MVIKPLQICQQGQYMVTIATNHTLMIYSYYTDTISMATTLITTDHCFIRLFSQWQLSVGRSGLMGTGCTWGVWLGLMRRTITHSNSGCNTTMNHIVSWRYPTSQTRANAKVSHTHLILIHYPVCSKKNNSINTYMYRTLKGVGIDHCYTK